MCGNVLEFQEGVSDRHRFVGSQSVIWRPHVWQGDKRAKGASHSFHTMPKARLRWYLFHSSLLNVVDTNELFCRTPRFISSCICDLTVNKLASLDQQHGLLPLKWYPYNHNPYSFIIPADPIKIPTYGILNVGILKPPLSCSRPPHHTIMIFALDLQHLCRVSKTSHSSKSCLCEDNDWSKWPW